MRDRCLACRAPICRCGPGRNCGGGERVDACTGRRRCAGRPLDLRGVVGGWGASVKERAVCRGVGACGCAAASEIEELGIILGVTRLEAGHLSLLQAVASEGYAENKKQRPAGDGAVGVRRELGCGGGGGGGDGGAPAIIYAV